MLLSFDTIEAFESAASYVFDKCGCGGIREMVLSPATVFIEGYKISIEECPTLVCQSCGNERIGHLMWSQLYHAYQDILLHNYVGGTLKTQGNQRFDYAVSAQYDYDSRDLNIPGCDVDLDPTHTSGFSCPVYFNRKVLNNFFHDDEYKLDFFSESYGSIAKKGTDGWEWEWSIVFGINKYDHVIMFLGDLDQIDAGDRAEYWLKSYNEKSDHTLVDTELYAAQMNCVWSDPIIEKRIILLRDSFYKRIKNKHGISLFHLEQEVELKGRELVKPVSYTKNEIMDNIIILDGLLNEGIDCDELKKLYKVLISPLPSNFCNLKSRKLLEGIIASKKGSESARTIIAPLFYLNDLRVCFAHLISEREVEKMKERIVNAYGLQSISEHRKLYDSLIDSLYRLYQYLNIEEL